MKSYRFSAFNPDGSKRTGVIEAASQDEAFSLLRAKNVAPHEIVETRQTTTSMFGSGFHFGSRHDPQLLLRTIQMLAILVSRKVPIPEALDLTLSVEPSRGGRKVLRAICKKVAEGSNLSRAVGSEKDFASAYIINLIEAGEKTAALGTVLESLAKQLGKEQELKRKIKGAFAYPIVLVCASLCMLFFMSLYMVPALMPLLEQSSSDIPSLVLFLDQLGKASSANIGLIGIAILAALIAYPIVSSTGVYKSFSENIFFKIPIIGKMMSSSETVRFCSSLGLMLQNHVPLVQALEGSAKVVRTASFSTAINDATPHLKEGHSLDEAFVGFAKLPKTFFALAKAGGETRALPDALSQISDVERAILEKQIDTAVQLLPPILTLVVGSFVGLFMLVIVDTIMSLNDAIL